MTLGEQLGRSTHLNSPPWTCVRLIASTQPLKSTENPGPSLVAGALTEAELHVLRHIAAHFDSNDVQRLNTPFEVPPLDSQEIELALRKLADSDPPYIRGIEVAELDYPAAVTGISERGRRAARH